MNEVRFKAYDNQGEVARVDHNNSKITCEPSIWIGENERTLTGKRNRLYYRISPQ